MLLSIQETPDLSKALYTARVHSAKECQRADGQLSQGGQVPQMLSFCCHLSSAKDPGAAFETFVLSISVDKHPALRSAGVTSLFAQELSLVIYSLMITDSISRCVKSETTKK